MACNLVINFEVALLKKLWQCSMPNGTLRVSLPSPPQLTFGEGEGTATRRLPTFQLVCQAFHSITFAFSSYSRSAVEARNCQIWSNRKNQNRIRYQIRKPVSIFRENWRPHAKKRKIWKPRWTPKPKRRFFWRRNRKKRKTDLKNSQNCRTEYPNALLLNGIS